MVICAVKKYENGGHDNQSWPEGYPLPEGFVIIPDDLETPNFPFGDITVENGVVTGWTPLPIPEPAPAPPADPTQLDVLEAQVTYTAMKTGTLIQTPKAKEARAND